MAASVPRLFPGKTVVCLASGPSLTAADVDWCRGKAPVVAVNDTHRLAPWADVLYACDAKWWEAYRGVPAFTGLKFSLEKRASIWGVSVLERTGERGVELEPTGLRTGMNSGYQAINLAVHLGARQILLLGYDMQAPASGPSHFFGEHPRTLRRHNHYGAFAERFDSMVEPLKALGVDVVNCSRQTALKAFRRQALIEALPA